jgi:hypothetical protein
MRMRQSLAQFEAAFREETAEERAWRERLRREAAERSRVRRQQRVRKSGTLRFAFLVLTILATTVIVTIAMFETLSLLIGG